MKTDFSNKLQAFLKTKGASIIGFADLKEIPSDNRDGFPVGVSIGVALSPKIISEIIEGPTKLYVGECLRLDIVLDRIGQETMDFLKAYGYKAKRQATTNITGTKYPPNFTTPLPHKTIATRAGLGWIGKCALLITKQFGSAIRLGSILTDADLSLDIPIETSQCGDCNVCSDICPARALSGKNWEVGMPRDSLIDVLTCQKSAQELLIKRTGTEVVGRTFCGICIASCPWTKNYSERIF